MPDGTPLDLNFTDWVDAPASPSKPGASDLNRIQNAIRFLANPPSARLSRSDQQTIGSSLTFTGMYWNVNAWETDPSMIDAGVGTGPVYTDKIYLPYVGEWEVGLIVRSEFNTTFGAVQVQLVKAYTGNNVITPVDQDMKGTRGDIAVVNRCNVTFLVSQQNVDDGIYIRAEYSQNSGQNATITTTSGIREYPAMWARWVGTGGLFG